MKIIDRETIEGMQSVRFARKGLLPVSGGVLEQTESFLQTMEAADAYDAIAQTRLNDGK